MGLNCTYTDDLAWILFPMKVPHIHFGRILPADELQLLCLIVGGRELFYSLVVSAVSNVNKVA